jgi:hypothetical protein
VPATKRRRVPRVSARKVGAIPGQEHRKQQGRAHFWRWGSKAITVASTSSGSDIMSAAAGSGDRCALQSLVMSVSFILHGLRAAKRRGTGVPRN